MEKDNHKFVAHYRPEDNTIQDVWTHLNNVGQRTAAITDKIGLAQVGELLGLTHDLGKATTAFNNYIRQAVGLPLEDHHKINKTKKVDHSTAGSVLVHKKLTDSSSMLASQILPLVIASHHSGLIDCLTVDGENRFERRLNKEESQSRVDEAINNAPKEFLTRISALTDKGAMESLLQESILSLFEPNDTASVKTFKMGIFTRFLLSALIDGDRIDSIDFQDPNQKVLRKDGTYPSWDILNDRLDASLADLPDQSPIDSFRKEISQQCLNAATQSQGIFRLTVPTGGGKTLASLRFALHHAKRHKLERIVYIIPYTSIIDQNANTIRSIMETDNENIVLEHHSNLDPLYQDSPEHKLYAQNWDAPIVMTTMVQYLEALFGSGTTSVRRMHQLAKAVIIFDEIQTLPIRCVHMFNVTLRFLTLHCKSSAVLCTATQPLLHNLSCIPKALPNNPKAEIAPNIKDMFARLKRVQVNDYTCSPCNYEDLASQMVSYMAKNQSVLAIVNTKRDALLVYQELKKYPYKTIFHLSTNMCPAHRIRILTQISNLLEKQEPLLCVSTQLIEAGVDLDFNVVFRSLTGLDSIQQASGRCNRHGKNAIGEVFIIKLKEENLNRLPEIRIGQEITERILGEFKKYPHLFDNDLLSPKATEHYYHYYFYQRQKEMDYPVSPNSCVGRHDSLFNLLSTNDIAVKAYKRQHQQKAPPLCLRQSFKTASAAFKVIEQSSRGVIVPYGNEGNELIEKLCALDPWEQPKKLLQKTQQYSVNCFPHVLDRLQQQRGLHGIRDDLDVYFIDSRFYSNEYGLLEDPSGNMETLNI